MATKKLTAERLRELLNYDPETGIFTWAREHPRPVAEGSIAGCVIHRGYIAIGIDGTSYLAHRLAWLHFYGKWPTGKIDHKDRCTSHNWIDNLRDTTQSVNRQNVDVAKSGSKLGIRGVSWDPNRKKFVAQLKLGDATFYKRFNTLEQARAAYLSARNRLHPGFHQ